MVSLWLDRAASRPVGADTFPASDFGEGAHYDVLIAGAGITGMTTALLLARAGKRVAVVEARTMGSVATGNSTAKLSLLQGSVLSDMLVHTARKNAQAYVDGNREGFAWLIRYLEDHDVHHERRDAFSYAGKPSGSAAVDAEFLAAFRLGLPVQKVRGLQLPFPTYGAVRLADQAQFDPMDVLQQLRRDYLAHGGVLAEGVRVTGVRSVTRGKGRPCSVRTTAGSVDADRVVLATGTPILDRGLYFAKVESKRSYAVAFELPEPSLAPLNGGMYLSVDSPSRSLRTAPAVGGELLIVGGNGHVVGRHPHPKALVEDLESWTAEHFPGAVRTHAWSAQDYQSMNRIPFVGWLPRSAGRVYLATGYNKWGMTNGVAAGLRLASDILGGQLSWAKTISRRVTRPPSQVAGAIAGAQVGIAGVTGWASAETRPLEPGAAPPDGVGEVRSLAGRPVGVCTVAGVTRRVGAVCPHLGGVVSWNDQELSWDCPLHGSRFSADGEVLEGPATRPLRAVD